MGKTTGAECKTTTRIYLIDTTLVAHRSARNLCHRITESSSEPNVLCRAASLPSSAISSYISKKIRRKIILLILAIFSIWHQLCFSNTLSLSRLMLHSFVCEDDKLDEYFICPEIMPNCSKLYSFSLE